jgi:DNA-binding SARP family transcriptional activator
LSSTKERILLAALLMRPNASVGAQSPAKALWDHDQPPSAAVTLRNHVRRLRTRLGPHLGARVTTRSAGYAVEVGDDECDLLAFRREFRAGTSAARLGDRAGTASCLTQALA